MRRRPLRVAAPAPRRLVHLVVLAALALAAPRAAAQPDPTPPAEHYADALRLYRADVFEPAARAFTAYLEANPSGPFSAEALFFAADATLQAGDAEQAEALFERFLRRYPSHPLVPRATLALGTFYYGQGRYADAARALRDALGTTTALSDEAAAEALYLLGQAELKDGRPDAALAAFNRIPAEYPRQPAAPRALYASGQIEQNRGGDRAAVDAFGTLEAMYPASEENARAGLALAEAYARLGDWAAASDAARRRAAALQEPDASRAYFLAGEGALREGDRAAARDAFERVDAASTYGRRARFGLGRVAFETRGWAEAAEHFAAVRTASGDTDDALAHEATYLEGLALKRAGQLGEAERRLAAATQRRPEGAFADDALAELGVLRYERRDYEPAVAAFTRLLERYPASPAAGEAALLLAESYTQLGRIAEARRATEQAEALGVGSGDLRGELRFQEAFALYTAGEHAAAADALYAVYQREPTGSRAGEALFWAGESAFQAREYGRAQNYLVTFLADFPRHRQADAARYALGWAYFKQRRFDDAAGAFERFLSAYQPSSSVVPVPYVADALLRLGDSYRALRRFGDAERVYARAERQATQSGGAGSDYALLQTALTQRDRGDRDAAIATLEGLLVRYPSSPLAPQVRYARGETLFQAGRYDEAIAAFRETISLHGGNPLAAKAQFGIGDAYYNSQRFAEAEVAYRGVLDGYPSSPFVGDALAGLQNALAAQGRGDEADDIAATYIEANPGSPAADALRFRQAELAYESGRRAEAQRGFAPYLNAPEDTADRPAALLYLGRIAEEAGDATTAQDRYLDVAETYPQRPEAGEALRRLGGLLLEAGRPEEALAAFEALDTGATSPEESVDAAFGRGLALLALGRPAEAEVAFRAAVEAGAGTTTGLGAAVGLGRALEAQGRTDAALSVYAQAAAAGEAEPAAEAAVRLARLHLAQRDAQAALDALADFEDRYGLFPEAVGEALLTQAEALQRLGRVAEAEAALDRLRTVYDDTPAAQRLSNQ